MQDCKVTIAALPSVLADKAENLETARGAIGQAARDGARLIIMPELMLTGHGAHPNMADNAEPVPDGPLCREIVELSRAHGLCICIGMAELCHGIVYNSQIVADRGRYLGLQRKIHLSGDEYCYFGAGDDVPVFDIGELRFGITICYDSRFPEMSLLHNLHHVDALLAAHAARTGEWPDSPDKDFALNQIRKRQQSWEQRYRGRAQDYNFFVLLCDAVGPSTRSLEGVVANHAGSVMAIDPRGEVILKTEKQDFSPEIRTIDLVAQERQSNHAPTRNRRLDVFRALLDRETQNRT